MSRLIDSLAGLRADLFWFAYTVSALLVPFFIVVTPLAIVRAMGSGLSIQDAISIGAVVSLFGLPWPILSAVLLRPKPPARRRPGPRIVHIIIAFFVTVVFATLWASEPARILARSYSVPEVVPWILLSAFWGLLAAKFSQAKGEFGSAYIARSARRTILGCVFVGVAWLTIDFSVTARLIDSPNHEPQIFYLAVASIMVVVAIFSAAINRRNIQSWQGRCRACGYRVGEFDPCPECGTPSPLFKAPQPSSY